MRKTDSKKMKGKRKHTDTTISLHPLTFEEAIEELSTSPKAEESDNTKEHAPESGPSKPRNVPHPKSSDD